MMFRSTRSTEEGSTMEEYLLRVAKTATQDVAQYLFLEKAPAWLRIATVAPLSNYGYPEGVEGALLKVTDRGLVTGVEGNFDAPHDFIPWANVSYISDGTKLYADQQKKK